MSHLSHDAKIKLVWRVCGILAFVTAFEIGAALIHYYMFTETVPKIFLDILFIVLSVAKAYYIMSEFMHLKYELKAMTISILAPFLFLVWAIIAFLYDGGSWLNLNNIWG